MNLPPATVDGVFLTHFHSDHIDDLGELMLQRWAGGAAASPLPVYGPTGRRPGGGRLRAGLRARPRLSHRPPRAGGDAAEPASAAPPHPFAIAQDAAERDADRRGGLKVIAFPVDHGPVEPAVGYRFVYKGRAW